MSDEPREIHPYQDWSNPATVGKDFSINQLPSGTPEPETEAPTQLPKESSAPASVDSSTLTPTVEPPESVTPAPTPVDKESGELNEPNAVTNPELFLPSSSSETSPGWSEPPVPGKPPTSEPSPKQ